MTTTEYNKRLRTKTALESHNRFYKVNGLRLDFARVIEEECDEHSIEFSWPTLHGMANGLAICPDCGMANERKGHMGCDYAS